MKFARLFAFCIFLAPSVLRAQDVQVRLFAAISPKSITVNSTQADFHWRECPTCTDHAEHKLEIKFAPEKNADGTSSAAPKTFFISGNYQIIPENGPAFSGNFPLQIKRNDSGFQITISMPMEQYVSAVLAAESGASKNDESLKAMAVAIRTYATRFHGQHVQDGFDFCDTTHCQTMKWNGIDSRNRAAVLATRGEILYFQDSPAQTFYHANCGGTTAAATEAWSKVSEPYLIVHADTFCPIPGELKWESNLSANEINNALRIAGISPPENWRAIEIESRTPSGRVGHLQFLGGSPPRFSLAASTLRFAVDREYGWNKIRSDLYEIRNANGKILFSGKGSGHGVGLCQAGAEEMAREGKSYREILNYYYPGTDLHEAQNQKWESRLDERFELLSQNPESDSQILPIADRILVENENSIGWKLTFRPRLQIYSTIEKYRDETGEPGWIAASTRVHTIRLQPIAQLKSKSILESTLRHELYHLLIESKSRAGIPLWFREGLALYLASPESSEAAAPAMSDQQLESHLLHPASREEMERAYAVAQRKVNALVQQFGKQKVLSWLSAGLPGDLSDVERGVRGGLTNR
jgi:stage II sporulation protein D